MTDRPTDSAIQHFKKVHSEVMLGINFAIHDSGTDGPYKVHVLQSIDALSEGMIDLSTAIRAVYILLEDVRQKQLQ